MSQFIELSVHVQLLKFIKIVLKYLVFYGLFFFYKILQLINKKQLRFL